MAILDVLKAKEHKKIKHHDPGKEVDKIPEKAYFTQSDAEQQTSKAVAL